MGKTTAGSILRHLGVRVVDTDQIAHDLTQPGQPALAEIREVFGKGYFEAGDRLRRDVLAQLIFSSESARRRLEAILHPRIRQTWLDRVEEWRKQGHSRAVAIIPLLFETDAAKEFDHTICVACSERLQHRRLTERGWTEEQIRQRVQAQLPVRKKIELADYVVWNDAGLEVFEAQLTRILSAVGA
jgi:dephospho-CoA kinase